ncbi:MAG: PadR family transcriptional regulator [Gemmatimonadaceae bacterium]
MSGFDCNTGWMRRGMWKGNWGFDGAQFWGGAPWRPRGGGSRAGRVFDQGDLKYVILQLLVEKPRHGYEIIKAIEERFGGAYSPSPGTVYPTLTMLEDMGYARVMPEESGKKVYEITDEGRKYLEENRSAVDDIFSKITDFAQSIFGEPMMQVHRAMKDVGRAVYVQNAKRTPDQLKRISDILERAATEIGTVV